MNLVVDAKDDLEDQRVDTKAYANEANEKTKWDRKLDIYTKSFDFTLDANYSFKISYKDLAGLYKKALFYSHCQIQKSVCKLFLSYHLYSLLEYLPVYLLSSHSEFQNH